MRNTLLHPSLWIFVIGSLISIVGTCVLALSLFRRKRTDATLLTFGATSLLYGLRLLLDAWAQQYVAIEPPRLLFYLMAFISYVIVIPLSGFLLHIFGKGWRNSLLWIFRGSMVFACAGILSDVVQAVPYSLERLNNVLVIVWSGLWLGSAFLSRQEKTRETRFVLAGFLVFGLFALNENLVSLNVLPWDWQGERYGFIAFLATLGYVTAHRLFRSEARLSNIEREMEIARQIQSSLLPHTLPAVHGLHMAARYVPMDSVAGDFYDVLVEDEKRVCLLVADVSGHGLGAALIASMLKIAFASQHGRLRHPEQVLAGMNQAFSGKLGRNFITAACAFLDTEAGELRYAAAGHPPLILHRKRDLQIHEFGDNGLILGPFPEATFPLTTIALESGDRIVLYTDGITETRNAPGSFFGDDGLKTFIKDHPDLSPGPFIDALLRHLSIWSGKPSRKSLDDDMTLLVLDVV